jgi:FkbM family methyltransferase
MSIPTRLRHSVIGRVVRRAGHIAFTLGHRSGEAVGYSLPGDIRVKLQPRGDVAEFLFYAPFFEREQLRLVRALLRPGLRVLDVGANSGLYSIFASRLVGDEGHVWALEPSAETFSLLLENLELNAPIPVTPVCVGVSDAPGTMRLVNDPGFGDVYRYVVPGSAGSGIGEPVRVTTLDALDEQHRFAPIDFLKLDIEGGEYRALRGARRVLEASEGLVIMFESDPQWSVRAGSLRENVFELLRSLGFGIYACSGRPRGWSASERDLLRCDMLWATRDARLLPVV